MKIDMSGEQPTIDARDLGDLLGLPPDRVHSLMRAGKITSRFEAGKGDDDGKVRLTFFYRARRVRLTCGPDGTVVSTSRVTTEQP